MWKEGRPAKMGTAATPLLPSRAPLQRSWNFSWFPKFVFSCHRSVGLVYSPPCLFSRPRSYTNLPCNQFPLHPALSRSDDDDMESRSSRVTQLCTYFQQKYKHLCRLERAESRQKKCRHTFRKALLQAASKEPECTGQLIQELRRAACSRARLEPQRQGRPSQALSLTSPYSPLRMVEALCEVNV